METTPRPARYYITPNYNIAIVNKVGSTALNDGVLKAYYPEKKIISGGAPLPRIDILNRARSPKTHKPTMTVLMPVREPIERFRSACAEITSPNPLTGDAYIQWVSDMLDVLEAVEGTYPDYHFRTQCEWLCPESTVRLYKYPASLDALAIEAGLATPLPVINGTDSQGREKPTLTTDQLARVRAYYAEDIALFDSIVEVGQELVVPAAPEPLVEPEPEPVYVPREATNYQVKQALNANPADRIAVDAFVANSGDQNVIDGWAYAHSFKKNHPLFLGAVVYLGWSQQKVDDLLILAATFD